MRVYCEHGALTSKLRALKRAGRVELIHFPYDKGAHSRHINGTAVPSAAQYRDINLTYGEVHYGDFSASEKLRSIRTTIGPENRRDALHIDSAYKSQCDCFVTRDRGIVSKRTELEALVGLRFFDPDDDWQAFVEFLELSEKTNARPPKTE
jgi:hypothetical protein